VRAGVHDVQLAQLEGVPWHRGERHRAEAQHKGKHYPHADGEHGSPADPYRFIYCCLHLFSFLS